MQEQNLLKLIAVEVSKTLSSDIKDFKLFINKIDSIFPYLLREQIAFYNRQKIINANKSILHDMEA